MPVKLPAIVLFAASMGGFAAPAAAERYVQPPQLTEVTVRVAWSTNDQIRRRCGERTFACATVGRADAPFSSIWSEKPSAKRDKRRVCTLGHEFLHSLGASHRQ